jgi:hypothetical protein
MYRNYRNERQVEAQPAEVQLTYFRTYVEKLVFDTMPSRDTREWLYKHGFNWDGTAWQRPARQSSRHHEHEIGNEIVKPLAA